MIVLRLRGGLGNQLFQYAAAKALAEQHGTALKLDLYYYDKHPYRKFELDKFNIPLEYATRKEVHAFTGSNRIVRYLNKRENYLRCPGVFTQPYYHFYPDFFRLPESIYLNGYFQSEKYFSPLRHKLLQWYTPAIPFDPLNAEISASMNGNNSVSLHVRRGDYSSRQFTSFFGTLPADYYVSAIKRIKEDVVDPHFFIFSDDIHWCKSNLPLTGKVNYLEHNKGPEAFKDLVLMSHCRHNIIANSSFSWWGAWLNQHDSKIVIAPKQWFRKDYYDGKEPVYPVRQYATQDLIPEGWLRV